MNQSRAKKRMGVSLKGIFNPLAWFGMAGMSFVLATQADGQDWPIGHTPADQPVRQYQSNYPLDSPSGLPPKPILSAHPPHLARPGHPTAGGTKLRRDGGPLAVDSTRSMNSTVGSVATQEQSTVPKADNRLDRDHRRYPVDPRKPCNVCTHPPEVRAKTNFNLPGLRGMPYQEQARGGCRCGNQSSSYFNRISVNWSAPFSALHDRHHLSSAELRDCPCQPKRLVDGFNSLADFKPIDYQRRDNGYCGPNADPYGCLGESRQLSRVAGVGFRWPGTPAVAPAPFNR